MRSSTTVRSGATGARTMSTTGVSAFQYWRSPRKTRRISAKVRFCTGVSGCTITAMAAARAGRAGAASSRSASSAARRAALPRNREGTLIVDRLEREARLEPDGVGPPGALGQLVAVLGLDRRHVDQIRAQARG